MKSPKVEINFLKIVFEVFFERMLVDYTRKGDTSPDKASEYWRSERSERIQNGTQRGE